LYCADILCHGTNSPLILKKYLEEKETIQNSKLIHFQFRTPKVLQSLQANEYVYENGITELLDKRSDLFMKAFLKNMILKRSCYECKYCKDNNISDITFGDFWGGKKFYTETDAELGISCLKINTSKGKELFQNMNIYAQVQSVTDMYKNNHKSPSHFPVQREHVFEWIEKDMSIIEALERGLRELQET
jgi:hypothetical protein